MHRCDNFRTAFLLKKKKQEMSSYLHNTLIQIDQAVVI